MPYTIKCPTCREETYAPNIIRLIDEHLDERGAIVCVSCGRAGAYIHLKSALQEKGRKWERYVKGVIRVPTRDPGYSPYALLIADGVRTQASAVQLCYFKDLRSRGGKLKHGHGPGGTPVLGKTELVQLLRRLAVYGALTKGDLKAILRR